MGLFSSLVHSGIQRGYFPLFIFLICLFLVLLLFSFSFFKLGSFPQDQFGANIWSETVHGEGRLGDFGRGGGSDNGRNRKSLSGFIWAAWQSAGVARLPRSWGQGLLLWAVKISPAESWGSREHCCAPWLCPSAAQLCCRRMEMSPVTPKHSYFCSGKGGILLEKVIGAAACSPSAAGCLSGASLARSVPLLPAPSGGFPPSPGSVVNPSQVGGCSKQTLPFLIPISPHSDPQIPLLLQGQILHHRCWGVLLGSSSLPGGGGHTSWAER